MTVIKNKRLLVQRAKWHAENDHVVQGTYGEAETNGDVVFHGCFIGCLATPHTKRGLKAWVVGMIKEYGYYEDDDEAMVERLEEEFGIIDTLARVAEQIFEGFVYHGEAIEFLPAFCRALPEGVDLDENAIWAAWYAIRSDVQRQRRFFQADVDRSTMQAERLFEWLAACGKAGEAVEYGSETWSSKDAPELTVKEGG